jgi:hypothetical protein
MIRITNKGLRTLKKNPDGSSLCHRDYEALLRISRPRGQLSTASNRGKYWYTTKELEIMGGRECQGVLLGRGLIEIHGHGEQQMHARKLTKKQRIDLIKKRERNESKEVADHVQNQ